MIKQQFTLYMENKPGALARITRLLAAAKVNIEGISATSSVDIGLVQIVVSNAVVTRKLLDRAKLPFVAQNVVLVPLRNKPGALADIVSRLARQGINVNYVYATACEGQSRCYAIISAPDLRRVEAACLTARR